MSTTKVVSMEVARAKQRPPDLVFTVELWRVGPGRFWHEPYMIESRIGTPDPLTYRILGHAIVEDGQRVWDESRSPRPPRRKIVKRRKGRR